MRIQWYGQSAFRLAGEQTVFIDPFDRPSEALAARGLEFNYAPIENVTADVLLITHEHIDHNAAEAIGGEPVTIRSTAGRSRIAGRRGASRSPRSTTTSPERCAGRTRSSASSSTASRSATSATSASRRCAPSSAPRSVRSTCSSCRSATGRRSAASRPPTLVRSLAPRLVLPMHYRTEAVNFLDPPDAFLAALGAEVTRLETSDGDLDELLGTSAAPRVVLFAPPLA